MKKSDVAFWIVFVLVSAIGGYYGEMLRAWYWHWMGWI